MTTQSRSAKDRLTPYESQQIAQIAAWKSQPPNPIAEFWNLAVLQAAKAVTWLLFALQSLWPDNGVALSTDSSADAMNGVAGDGRLASPARKRKLRHQPRHESITPYPGQRLTRKNTFAEDTKWIPPSYPATRPAKQCILFKSYPYL
jgi:hypothetical protein